MSWSLKAGHQFYQPAKGVVNLGHIEAYLKENRLPRVYPETLQLEMMNDVSFLREHIPSYFVKPNTKLVKCFELYQKISKAPLFSVARKTLIDEACQSYHYELIEGIKKRDITLFSSGTVLNLARYPVELRAPNNYGFREPVFSMHVLRDCDGVFVNHQKNRFTVAKLKD